MHNPKLPNMRSVLLLTVGGNAWAWEMQEDSENCNKTRQVTWKHKCIRLNITVNELEGNKVTGTNIHAWGLGRMGPRWLGAVGT